MIKTNIVICGGHLSPAMATVERLQKRKTYQVCYIGRKYALEGDKAYSLEYKTIRKLHIPFYVLNSGRLQRFFTRYTIISLLKFPLSVVWAFIILRKIRPKIILSFGSYVALPVGLAGWLLHIPIISHEQTHVLGLTNRILSKFAKVLCLSWPGTKYVTADMNTVVTGIPLRNFKLSSKISDLINFGDTKLPLIYITGGSLGSHVLNDTVGEILPNLTSSYRLIHQTGISDNEKDFSKLLYLKNSLPQKLQRNYKLIKQIAPSQTFDILHSSSLIVGRAGANTVVEVQYAGKPAIFVPLPWSADNEQEINAKRLADYGSAILIKQSQLTGGLLLEKIREVMGNIENYNREAQSAKRQLKTDAAEKLAKMVDSYIK